MSDFNIVRKCEVERTFRVAHIMSDFDVKPEHANETFRGNITLPQEWKCGIIFGASGTGKTTIANEVFKDTIRPNFKYVAKSVIDDMPKGKSMQDIERMFYAVGLGSVPSWMKPYGVLSNGEKMRVDLARTMLEANEGDIVLFDEFTSVVDRQVAQTLCIALRKMLNRTNIRFIAVSCHKDIVEYLQPDWAFCTDDMRPFVFRRALKKSFTSESAALKNGKNLGVIII